MADTVSDGGTPAAPEHLVVGQISKPHGTKGEVFVWPLTDRPDDVFAQGSELLLGDVDGRLTGEGEVLSIESRRPFKRGVLVKFEGFEDRSDVEPYSGSYLLLPVSHLAPLEDGEVFYHELLGLNVVTMSGEPVGKVREVYDTEPAHLIEVKSPAGRMRLIPFTKEIVREVNLERGVMTIDPPEGLLDV